MTVSDFVLGFFKRKGSAVFIALAIEKAVRFLLVIIAAHFLTKNDYGAITYANTSLTFILPFIGMGIHQGLIRYGSISKSQQEKKVLFNMALKKGLILSIGVWVAILLLAPFVTQKMENSFYYLLILSFQIFSLYLLGVVKIYARLINRNKLYAKIVITNIVSLLVSVFLLTYSFKGIGYVISLAVVPFLVSIWYIFSLRLTNYNKLFVSEFKAKELIKYGLNLSIANVISQLLYAVDILLIGNILIDEKLVAQYKVANILPFSFLFLPIVVMTSDFVMLAKKSSTDKGYIKGYYLNYLKIFFVISIALLSLFFFFSNELYTLFGKQYSDGNNLMFIFSVGVVGALLFRVPLGNIMSAIGWPKVNLVVSILTLIVNVFLSYYLLNLYGIKGVAYATSFLMWFSGLLFLGVFIYYIRKKITPQ